jgi:hypothetical protein
MGTTRLDGKRRGEANVDQEKSIVDVFEHVICGVRLNHLRELLRKSSEGQKHSQDRDGWRITVEPTPA